MKHDNIVKQFLDGLREHLPEDDILSLSFSTGASPLQLAQLKARYPDCPKSLIELLATINGTYWQKYGEHTIALLILGSDVTEYPYYLKSVEQILDENNETDSINEIYKEYRHYFPDLVDAAINPDTNLDKWLCFSDCMNNGGTSSIYIDFNPSDMGKKGQIVRFLHDPDNYKVIADSFDNYLRMLIDSNYSFVFEDN
ncbi:MAG: SMI1/KNR4 family protein [Taibaiella sp.]|nr:SMI1/KNR4 family protein [Taibaiella sp.]